MEQKNETINEKTELENLTEEIKNLTNFLKTEKEEKQKQEQERIEKEKQEKEKQEKEKIEKLKQQEKQEKQENQEKTEEKQEKNIENKNQFFKDIEEKKFDFKYRKIIDGEKEIMLVDNTEYNSYMATKINEFTTFFYVTVFFLFVILTFNFIKTLLGK